MISQSRLKAKHLRLVATSAPQAQADQSPGFAAPQTDACELAADMAELFAHGLLRDVPFAAVTDPHRVVAIDGATRFTLHELLCELRCLSWFDSDGAQTGTVPACSRAASGEAGHRQRLRRNGDGQLTLNSLFRAGLALADTAGGFSGLWDEDVAVARPAVPVPTPDGEAAMSDWVRWCQSCHGAGLRLPGASGLARPDTLKDLTQHVARAPAARVFYNTALRALSQSAPFDPGLSAPRQGTSTGARLFRLLSQAEARARETALSRLVRLDRGSRPAVVAARMTVHLAQDDVARPDGSAAFRIAADELQRAAPALLYWMTRANAVLRGPQRFADGLFLPLCAPFEAPVHPSDLATHGVVAGALATILKAVLDGDRVSPSGAAGCPQRVTLAQDLDRVCADIARARLTAGLAYPRENHEELRLGETIALDLLRDALTADNRRASLSLTDFDGCHLSIEAGSNRDARVRRRLGTGGRMRKRSAAAGQPTHLTAVV